MLKRIIITAIVSGLCAKALNTWTRRAAAQRLQQEVDVQRWEDEGGHSGAADAADRTQGAQASKLRA
jgi:cobalamin biosynthesis protein CbiG